MALNDAPTNVTSNEGDSGITTTKAQSSKVVFVLEEGNDFNAIKSDNITSGEGDIAMQAGMERDQKHLLHEVLPIHAQEDPYLTSLLGQEKYIASSKKLQHDGWRVYVSISLLCFLYEMLLAQDCGLENVIFSL